MEPSFINKYSVLVVMVSVLLQVYTSRCCLEHEKVALLQLKSYFMATSTSVNITRHLSNELSSWDINGERNCCLWNRVACNNSTQHVTELSLNSVRANIRDIRDGFYNTDETMVLNVSLFQPFGELINLSLSSNNIQGLVGNGGYKRLSLRKLEVLYFEENFLQLEELGDLVGSLTSLRKLFLLGNILDGNFPGQELSHLKKLEVLDLSENGLIGSPLELSYLKNLRVLDLTDNGLNGSLQDQGLCKLMNLEHLGLYGNEFSGSIPNCLWNLTSLRVLDLSFNSFNGNMPALINLPSLQHLSLYSNNIQGRLSLCYLMNHSRIESLFLSNNTLHVEIEDSSCLSTHKLVDLGLGQCNLIGPSEFFPNFLSNQSSLDYLDLSSNGLTGPYPKWLLQNNSKLQYLNLRNNSIWGSFTLPKYNLSLEILDVSSNKLNGKIPGHIGMVRFLLGLISSRTLGGNQLEGELPVQLCRLKNVNIIDLSNNNISGFLHKCFRSLSFGSPQLGTLYTVSTFKSIGIVLNDNWSFIFGTTMYPRQEEVEFTVKNRYTPYKGNILTLMSSLDLSGNKLNGEIPPELGEFGMIQALNLSRNFLNGPIPRDFSKLKSIESLDLSSNNLSGAIPLELADLTFLGTFNVSYNNLSGEVPETGQFGTFDESNYRGNPFLCGSHLPRRCEIDELVSTAGTITDEEGGEGFDMEVFLWSFGMTFITVLLAFIVVLAINPHWRRIWFVYIDVKFLWWFHP